MNAAFVRDLLLDGPVTEVAQKRQTSRRDHASRTDFTVNATLADPQAALTLDPPEDQQLTPLRRVVSQAAALLIR